MPAPHLLKPPGHAIAHADEDILIAWVVAVGVRAHAARALRPPMAPILGPALRATATSLGTICTIRAWHLRLQVGN